MKIIELLSSQLDREAMAHEVSSVETLFSQRLEFWQLCFEARRILNEQKELKFSMKKTRVKRKGKEEEEPNASDKE